MTIEECRAKNCVHASVNRNRRNCGVTDCSRYDNYFQERWTEEEDWEFDDCVDEEITIESDIDNSLDKLISFLRSNKVDFNVMIRCFNFWSGLSSEERANFIDMYQQGKLKGKGGWY